MRKKLLRFAFVVLFLVLLSALNTKITFAQNTSDEPFIASSDASGEETILEIENMVRDAKQNGERFFVITSLGKGETSSRINSIRLLNVRQKFSQMGVNLQTTVFAEGKRVENEGKIEFYLGSRLRLVTLAERNKMPNLTCCEDYFPPLKSNPRRKKTKKLKRTT